MNWLVGFLITSLVTAISLVVISKIPFLGVEVDSIGKALIAGIVFGILNAILYPVLFWLTIPITVITLGLFLLILNAFIFGLSAKIVEGFRLRNGIWSAILGAIALSIVNGLVSWALSLVGLVPTAS